ncbi:MAG: hypothetical protein KDJ19_07995 [Hyphomicrobiaceae bacterium]|nr:hypothetical protein [Hyphomicrobiaceae bacterium]MCC0023528.1 hypothetical protein [Hyphomicrobiaceae bacterium]
MTHTNIKRGLLAAGVAIAGLGLAAVPAQAANLSFTFSFGTPNLQVYSTNQPHVYVQQAPQPVRTCLTNREIIRGLKDQGYRDVEYVSENIYGHPIFSFWSSGWVYQAQVDRCTGVVSNVERVSQPTTNTFVVIGTTPRPYAYPGPIIYHRD